MEFQDLSLPEINKELYNIATLIAAYSNPHMHTNLAELDEKVILTELFELEELFDYLLKLKIMKSN